MQFNEYALILLACGCAAIVISFIIFGKVGSAVRSYGYLTLGIATWSIAYAFELASDNYESMRFWVNIEYIGISFLPSLFLLFIIKFIGKESLITPMRLFYLFIFPCVTLIMVWTDPWHHLHYSSIYVDRTGPFPMLALKMGIWYILHTIFFYSIILISFYLLLRTFIKADNIYRRQNFVIILGAGIPWIVNVLYILGIRPLKHFDLTPYAFFVTSALIGIGLLRFRLFDIVPIARDKVIEELEDGILVLDSYDRVVDYNATMKEILQLKSGVNPIGKSFNDFFISESYLHDIVRKRINIKYDLKMFEGVHSKYYQLHLNPLFDKKTIFSGLIITFNDITERKLADEILNKQALELKELNQLKDKLFSIISHDLRGPILSLNEIMIMFNEKVIEEKDFISYIPLLTNNIKNTSSLLENLLYWSRSQLKGEIIQPESIPIKLSFDNQIQLLQLDATAKGIVIENQLKPEVFVYADRTMIDLVIRNLLSNALKFSKANDKIRIYCIDENDKISVCIQDSGVGISEENIEKLFGMKNFSTLGTNQEIGTGLGLMLCKEFIEKNKGRIWVESTIGQGSTFYFSLPKKK